MLSARFYSKLRSASYLFSILTTLSSNQSFADDEIRFESHQTPTAWPSTLPDMFINTESIVFPSGARVIDVTQLGADPSPGNDDTNALLTAFETAPKNSVIYIPDGVYEIAPNVGSSEAALRVLSNRVVVQGQSQSGTILKFLDNQSAAKALVSVGIPTNGNTFFTYIRNLTIDMGQGNPAGKGLIFYGNNRAGVEDVTIQSKGFQGTGLILSQNTNGPGLIQNVNIIGFGLGILSSHAAGTYTFENIYLKGQANTGWIINLTAGAEIKNLVSINDVTTIWAQGDGHKFTLQNSQVYSLTGSSTNAPFHFKEHVYLRNVATFGFIERIVLKQTLSYNAIAPLKNSNNVVFIPEYWVDGAFAGKRRGGTFQLADSAPDSMLKLEASDAPKLPQFALSQWKGIHEYGNALPDDELDDSSALQLALNSGAKVVYLGFGNGGASRWCLSGTITIPASVQKIKGVGVRMTSNKFQCRQGAVNFEIMPRSSPLEITDIEGEGDIRIKNLSTETLHLNHVNGFNYISHKIPDGNRQSLYLTDVVLPRLELVHTNLWARNLNIEVTTSPGVGKLENNGGVAWVLGMKVENQGSAIVSKNGAFTEVFGIYSNFVTDEVSPRFLTLDTAAFSIVNFFGGNYKVNAREVRNGETREVGGIAGKVYSAFSYDNVKSSEIIVDTEESTESRKVVLENGAWQKWVTNSLARGGNINDSIWLVNDDDASASFFPGRISGYYEVFVRWTPEYSGFNTRDNFRYTIHTGFEDSLPIIKDVSTRLPWERNGGNWESIGAYNFADSPSVKVVLTEDPTVNASGVIIADAIKFVKRHFDEDTQGEEGEREGGED